MTSPYDHHKNNFVTSVSPNGKELVSLDISNNTLQTWKLIDKNLIPVEHFWQHHQSSTTDSALFSRSIAISDRDKNNNIFIVISKIYEQDLHVKGKKRKEEEKTEESLQEVVSSLSSSIPHHNYRPSIDSDSTLTYHNNSAVLAYRPNHHNNSSISSIPTHHNNSSISSIPAHHNNSSISLIPTHHHNSSVSSVSRYTHHSNPSVSSHPISRNTHHQNNLSVASTPIFTHQHNLSVDSSNSASLIDFRPSYREEHAIIIIHVKADKTNRIIDSSTIRGLRGGIVEFIDSNTLIILRGTEFTRIVLEEDKILNFTLHPDQFQYQESMIRELKMRSLKSSKALLSRTVVKHYFFLCKSTRENNIFEMYDLRDFELKHVFHTKKIGIDNLGCEYNKYNNDGGFRTPLYAISENGKLMAVSLCKKSIAIFLIENSLMVAIHDFCNKFDSDNSSSAKILDMKFYDNDEKLVVLTQEGNNEVYTTIWDLFNCNIHNPYTAHLDPSNLQSLEEPIDYGMRKYKQSKGRPLGIFSNYLVYPSQFVNGNNGVYLIPFNQEEDRWNKYVTKIDTNKDNVYNDKKNHYKVYDHNGKLLDSFDHHKLIIKDSEPWNNSDDKTQIVVWLNDKKTIQLIIGNETIQVWEEHKKLVYIWAPLLSRSYYIDTFNKPADSPISSLSYSRSDHCKIHRFILKKFSNHQYQYKIRFSFGDKDISKHLPREKDYIKSACNAIEFLQWQMKHTKYLDNKLRRYLNKTIQETRLLIKKFIDEQPQTWKLLDIKECIMSHLVAAGCDDLISYIVDEKRDLMLHNPRRYAWSKRESDECNRLIDVKRKILNREIPQIPQQEKKRLNGDCLRKPSDLKIAIDHKNKNAVKGLVRYYSILAMDHTGWMFTVSDELLELLKYNSDYVVDLFYQPIFGSKEAPHLSEASITSEISLPGTKNSLHVLHDIQTKLNKSPNTTDNKLLDLKNAAPWVMACMVPLPDFTVPKDEKDKTSKQSTFIQMVISSSNDNMDFIFDNPAMEAIVDFKWCTYAKKIIYFLLALYGFYQLCFTYLCYAYIAHLSSNDWKWIFFYPFACWILLFGIFLLICEASQGKLLKKNYFRIYNLFDLLSGILPLLSTTLLLVFSYSQWKLNNNGFENIKTDSIVLILLSITMLTLWIELLMRMRSLQIIGEYVFLIINLSKRIAPFLGTMLVVICGLAHSMFILLSRPNDINLIPNQNTYTLLNTATQENYTLTQNIDVNSDNDNIFHNFFTSIKAVYFWINGQWDQIDQWNFWPVVGLSIFGSLFLVIIMQNILIALMSDVVDEAKEIGKRAFLKLRAELIAEVEVFFLTKRQLRDKVLFPRHIYFIINCDEANRWLEKCRRRNNIGYSNYGGRDRRESIHSNNSTKKDFVNSENNEPFGNKNRLAEIEKNINLLIELAKKNP
ncbi:hypothetical protein C1646_765830 [Rhizophagus diaphanus]|nr:hypothetical protein C1646_765830 [Rhizophagus diaphanus] [Rhizophagus sp. MUCL 43196]